MGLFDDVDGSGDAEGASPDPFVTRVTEMLDHVGVLLAAPDDALPFLEIELPLGDEAWVPDPVVTTGADHLGDWALEDAFSVEPADDDTSDRSDDRAAHDAGSPEPAGDAEAHDLFDAEDGAFAVGIGFEPGDPILTDVAEDDLLDTDLALEDEVPIEEEPYDYGDV